MSSPMSSNPDPPRKSALKSDDDGDKSSTSLTGGSAKAVQIAEPAQTQTPPVDEAQYKKQFPAGVARRLSGRPPLPSSASKSSLLSQASLDSLSNMISNASSVSATEDAASAQSEHQHRHRINRVSEKLLAQVADWLEHEKAKKSRRKSKKVSSPRRKSPTSGTPAENAAPPEPKHHRAPSMDSESSDVSFDRLQRILDDSLTAFGLSSVPRFSPRLGRRHKKSLKSIGLGRAASSDTEFFDGDPLVPSCDAFLDNSKATSYHGGKAATEEDDETPSGKKDGKENQGWIVFKNDIIRIAHTLKLKGWRRVPLDGGDLISVQRLSGALTNAVYVVTPPEDMAPAFEGQKPPSKLLLRLYGPHVDIDRDNELRVLRRLARKKIGPRLLGTFQNGRFEQFFEATTLTRATMREPDTSKQIAKRMRELHDGIELLEEERAAGPTVWQDWDRWTAHVEQSVTILDKQVLKAGKNSSSKDRWSRRGFLLGVEWHVFKAMVDKYRKYLEDFYGGPAAVRDRLVFSHNDTQYGNILRVRPENKKSPLLQPANEHKQLIVIDFEYAGANVPGLEFANHFTEWSYNYHDEVASFACNTAGYPTPEEQFRFAKAYVDHRPQFPHAGATPTVSPLLTPLSCSSLSSTTASPTPTSVPGGGVPGGIVAAAGTAAAATTPMMQRAGSTSSIVEFMLDARSPSVGPGGNWTAEDAKRDEESDRRAKELIEEARLWRIANSVHWVAWGIAQVKMPLDEEEKEDGGVIEGNGSANPPATDDEKDGGVEEEAEEEEEGFDYLLYAQDRAFFFWGDCVLAGLVKADDLPQKLREQIKLVPY